MDDSNCFSKFCNRLKLNSKAIISEFSSVTGIIFGVSTVVLSFVTWDELGINSVGCKVAILILMMIASILISAIYILLIKQRNMIWSNGTGSICVIYSDILKEAFSKRKNSRKVIVIPVNTCFDTIIDQDIGAVRNPLVSLKSIHGRWLKLMNDAGVTSEQIDKKVAGYLSMKDIQPIRCLSRESKSRGNLLEYSNGTIAVIDGNNNTTFFLLALSEFDEQNNAHGTKEILADCVKSLLLFYNQNGQGYDVYVPLLGTGLSRINISHKESLQIISSVLKLYTDSIFGNFKIAIYNDDKDKVSIFDI